MGEGKQLRSVCVGGGFRVIRPATYRHKVYPPFVPLCLCPLKPGQRVGIEQFSQKDDLLP
jgi:hypothetical protein